jgi:PIN domain nuclease of toxin-antitoxin system
MRLLLDTVTFLWLAEGDPKLSERAGGLIVDPANEVFLSSASSWEIAIKHGLGRLHLRVAPQDYVPEQRRLHRIEALPISEEEVLQVGKLPSLHRDPFDRVIVAQAIVYGMVVATPDEAIRKYPVRAVW